MKLKLVLLYMVTAMFSVHLVHAAVAKPAACQFIQSYELLRNSPDCDSAAMQIFTNKKTVLVLLDTVIASDSMLDCHAVFWLLPDKKDPCKLVLTAGMIDEEEKRTFYVTVSDSPAGLVLTIVNQDSKLIYKKTF